MRTLREMAWQKQEQQQQVGLLRQGLFAWLQMLPGSQLSSSPLPA
jgi:hypothetical protein